MANPSVSPVPSFPAYQTPNNDPQSMAVLRGQGQLFSQQTADEVAQLRLQSQNEALATAGSIRQDIQSTMHTLANQAESSSHQFVGDEVAQAKKGLDESGKAV